MAAGANPLLISPSTSSCIALAIDLGRHEVEARDHRDEVRDHEVPTHLLDDADGGERARANLAAIGERRAVAHHVPAHVAAGAFDADVAVARRRLEVARHLGDHRTRGEPLQALAEDLAALLHLPDADDVAVEAVAHPPHLAPADGDLEIELGIDGVRLVATDIVPDTRATEVRPDQVVVDGVL